MRGNYPDPLPLDPDRAHEILEKQGWHDTNGDGIREKEGKAFHFTALISSRSQAPKKLLFMFRIS
jgi:peptide/nickel transport system substrate-binding protein